MRLGIRVYTTLLFFNCSPFFILIIFIHLSLSFPLPGLLVSSNIKNSAKINLFHLATHMKQRFWDDGHFLWTSRTFMCAQQITISYGCFAPYLHTHVSKQTTKCWAAFPLLLVLVLFFATLHFLSLVWIAASLLVLPLQHAHTHLFPLLHHHHLLPCSNFFLTRS